MANDFFDLFEGVEVISCYSDSDALEDGTLCDSSVWFLFYNKVPINRITTAAIDKICSHFQVTLENGLRGKVEELIEKVRDDNDFLLIDEPVKLWLIPNEVRGLTLMRPSDY